MGTIYVVTKGSYSDYRISGIFDDKTLAEQYCTLTGGDIEDDIEEYELNREADRIRQGLAPYHVLICPSGDILKMHATDCYEDVGKLDFFPWKDHAMEIYVLARDKNHAAKIANEKRAQILALGLWGNVGTIKEMGLV